MKLRLGIIFLSLLCCATLEAQIKETMGALYKANEVLKSSAFYSVESEYKLFKSSTSPDPVEMYKGFSVKEGENSYSKIKDTEQVIVKGFHLTINNQDRKIIIQKLDRVSHQENIDIEGFLTITEKLWTEESGDEYVFHFELNEQAGALFDRFDMIVEKGTFLTKSIVYFFGVEHDFSTDYSKQEMSKPRLEITLHNYEMTKKSEIDYFRLSNYVQKKQNGWVGTTNYEHYEIIEL